MDAMTIICGLILSSGGGANLLVSGKPVSQLITAEIVPETSALVVPSSIDSQHRHVATAAISKTVHYADTPLITGYSSTVYKPDLTGIQHHHSIQTKISNQPLVRPVHTIVPKITHIQPEVTFQKIPVDVPIASPVINELEVRTPILQNHMHPTAVKSVYTYPAVYYPGSFMNAV